MAETRVHMGLRRKQKLNSEKKKKKKKEVADKIYTTNKAVALFLGPRRNSALRSDIARHSFLCVWL